MRPVIAAVVQARMGSRRLPGKVLADVCGQTLLERVVRRAREVTLPVIVATTWLPEDDAIEAEAGRLRVGCYRGPVDDVLARVLGAARAAGAAAEMHGVPGAQWVLRCCADSCEWPVAEVRFAASVAVARRADLIVYDRPCAIQGVDVVSVAGLADADRVLPPDDPRREHCAIGVAGERGIVVRMAVPETYADATRRSVDTQADLDALRRRLSCA